MKFDIKENKLRIYAKKVVDINFINSYKKKNKHKKLFYATVFLTLFIQDTSDI